MKVKIIPLPLISLSLVSLLTLSALNASASEIYPLFSIGYGENNITPSADNINFSRHYTPEFSLGFAKDIQLDENWQLTSSLALSFSKTYITQNFSSGLGNSALSSQGQLKELGLWAGTKIKRENLFSGALSGLSPFVSFDMAIINAEYQVNSEHYKKSIPGYKITTGLEFEVTKHSTFSIGVAYSDFDELELSPNTFY